MTLFLQWNIKGSSFSTEERSHTCLYWVNVDSIVFCVFIMNSLLLGFSTACWVMSSAVISKSSGNGSCSFRLRDSSVEEIQSSNRCTSSLSASRADSVVWILSACCFAHIWTWCTKSHMYICNTTLGTTKSSSCTLKIRSLKSKIFIIISVYSFIVPPVKFTTYHST